MTTADVFDPRQLPHSVEAEQSVLGALLLAGSRAVDEVALLLRPADFYRPAHQVIYSTILELNRAGEAIDALTVFDALTKAGAIERVGGGPYLHTLTETVPTAANATYYAKIVKEQARLRALVEVGTRIAQYGYTGSPEGIDGLIAQAHQDLIDQDPDEPSAPTLDEAVVSLVEWMETGDGDNRIALPYRDLDELLGGLKPGQMIVVGARPGMGKSVVGLDIARHAALKLGLPVYLASLEMSQRELMLRLIAAEGAINLTRLQDRTLTDAEWARFSQVTARLAETKHLIIDDTPNVTIDRLRAELRKLGRSEVGAPRLVVVDYLQLMRSPDGGRRTPENRQVEVSELSRNLKLLAREFNIPVVVLSQLNRAVEQRADRRPVISDLRESGSLEQDADAVLLLHRDDEMHPGELEIIVGKNRNGRTGSAAVAFQGHYGRAVNMATI